MYLYSFKVKIQKYEGQQKVAAKLSFSSLPTFRIIKLISTICYRLNASVKKRVPRIKKKSYQFLVFVINKNGRFLWKSNTIQNIIDASTWKLPTRLIFGNYVTTMRFLALETPHMSASMKVPRLRTCYI